jgi:hypothetical protein
VNPKVVLASDDVEDPPAAPESKAWKARTAAQAAGEEPRDGQAAENENEPREGARLLELSEYDEDERDRRETEARHRENAEKVRGP